MPARSRSGNLVLGMLLVVVSLSVVGSAVAWTPQNGPAGATAQHDGTLPELSNNFTIDIEADGDARWTVALTTAFDNNTTRADFKAVTEGYERGRTTWLPVTPYRTQSERLSTVTGREMNITNVSRTRRVGNETGTLVLSFRWTNFGERRGGDLYVQDVFIGGKGQWFASLEPFQRLTIRGPPDHEIISASQGFQNQTLRWQGPVTFGLGSPYVVYNRDDPSPPPPTSPTPDAPVATTTAPASGDSGEGGEGGVLMGAVVVVLVGTLAVVAYVATQRDGPLLPTGDSEPGEGTTTGNPDGGSVPTPTPVTDTAEADESEPDPADGTEHDDTDEEAEIDEALLSDEERVERLLEVNGGRMKQANIVTETGWSNAKVSQLLSSMADEGRIEKLRIGRENLISFPDESIVDNGDED